MKTKLDIPKALEEAIVNGTPEEACAALDEILDANGALTEEGWDEVLFPSGNRTKVENLKAALPLLSSNPGSKLVKNSSVESAVFNFLIQRLLNSGYRSSRKPLHFDITIHPEEIHGDGWTQWELPSELKDLGVDLSKTVFGNMPSCMFQVVSPSVLNLCLESTRTEVVIIPAWC